MENNKHNMSIFNIAKHKTLKTKKLMKDQHQMKLLLFILLIEKV